MICFEIAVRWTVLHFMYFVHSVGQKERERERERERESLMAVYLVLVRPNHLNDARRRCGCSALPLQNRNVKKPLGAIIRFMFRNQSKAMRGPERIELVPSGPRIITLPNLPLSPGFSRNFHSRRICRNERTDSMLPSASERSESKWPLPPPPPPRSRTCLNAPPKPTSKRRLGVRR